MGKFDIFVYFVDMSTYDEVYTIGKVFPSVKAGTNKMKFSIKSFEDLVIEKSLNDVTILIVFNKFDQFKKKLTKENGLEKTFPEYKGNHNIDKSTKFIVDLYKSQVKFNPQRIKTVCTSLVYNPESCLQIVNEMIRESFQNTLYFTSPISRDALVNNYVQNRKFKNVDMELLFLNDQLKTNKLLDFKIPYSLMKDINFTFN